MKDGCCVDSILDLGSITLRALHRYFNFNFFTVAPATNGFIPPQTSRFVEDIVLTGPLCRCSSPVVTRFWKPRAANLIGLTNLPVRRGKRVWISWQGREGQLFAAQRSLSREDLDQMRNAKNKNSHVTKQIGLLFLF